MYYGGPSWWTDERVAELKIRWHNNESAFCIAKAMHAVSRNAVIGKARRLKLEIRTRAHGNGAKNHKNQHRPKVKRLRLLPAVIGYTNQGDVTVTFENPKPLIELGQGDCRWPGDGDPADANLQFCAAPVVNGYSYCARHCVIAYVKPGPRPKAPR